MLKSTPRNCQIEGGRYASYADAEDNDLSLKEQLAGDDPGLSGAYCE
jgi:hypothetical protein